MSHASKVSIGWTSRFGGALILCVALAFASGGVSEAQAPAPATKQAASPAPTPISFDVLKGHWVRPDGGYRIEVKSIGTNGQIDAMYFNPRPLPFSKAQVTQDGSLLRVFLELQAGGYGGSTYELTYDAANDRLKGIYYQAVMKQRFEVVFARK